MLKNSSVLLLNCLGSYFYSIFDLLMSTTNKQGFNVALYYLAFGTLEYKPLVIEDIKKEFGNNPWGYQPVVIRDRKQSLLEINSRYFAYIKEYSNVQIVKINMDNNIEKLHYYLDNKIDEKHFFICNVDEYYLSSSEEFYRKQHNKHFLLIKNVDSENRKLDIIDSEKNKEITMSYAEMEQAIIQSKYKNKQCLYIDASNYHNDFDKNKIINSFLSIDNSSSYKYLLMLIKEIQENSKLIENSDIYFYKAYYYTILSKIIPYSLVRCTIYSEKRKKLYQQSNTIFLKWKSLCNFMLYKMKKGDYSTVSILKKLVDILVLEKTMYSKVEKIYN